MSRLQRVQSFESLLKKTKGFNSLSHFSRQDHVQKNGFNFYESCWKKRSILWVVFEKGVQFCEWNSEKINSWSHFFFFWKYFLKGSSLWVLKKIFEFFFLVRKNQVFESCYKEGFNSSSHIEKNLWDILKRSSVLCIVFLGKAQFFESFFFFLTNSKIQFFESHSKKKNNSLSHAQEISILWVIFWKKKFRSSSHTQKIQLFELHSKRVQFFESFFFFWKEFKFLIFFLSSILWVIVKKGFNSLSHFSRQDQSFLWVKIFVKKNSMSHVEKMGSIL